LQKYKREGTKGYIFYKDNIPVGAVRVAFNSENSSARVSALGVLPKYQGQGIARKALLEIERLHRDVKKWCLDTILQEKGNCHLYEKIGYKRTGKVEEINEKMTLIYYEKKVNDIVYRLAEENDIEEIIELVENAISKMEEKGIYQWDDLYPTVEVFLSDIKSRQLYVGIIDKEISVIYVVNNECDEAYQNGNWKYPTSEYRVIHRLCVNPKYQNKGVAGSTLKHIENELRTQNIESIRLDVFSENPFALSLYEKNGYKEVGFADWRKGRFFLMEKHLLEKIYIEEDLFPREITSCEERDYGYLFCNEKNKDSYDSNHALIYKDRITNLDEVFKEILEFYIRKGIKPNIYESVLDEGFFEEIVHELEKYGFETWKESQKYMVLSDENVLKSNPDIIVKIVTEWADEYGTEIFEKAGETWGIDVLKRALQNSNTKLFVGFYNGIPIGMTYCHITEGVCRIDYLLVSKEYRNIGAGRAIINCFVEYCKTNHIELCYLWPDGETAEKIYYEAGFRHVQTKNVGRAVYNAK